MAVVDFLEVVHVEKHQREGTLGPPRALDLGLDPVDQLPVVRETRERITHREVAELPFNLSPLGHDRGQDERRHRRDPHVGLQQDQRLVRRSLDEGAEAAECPHVAMPDSKRIAVAASRGPNRKVAQSRSGITRNSNG